MSWCKINVSEYDEVHRLYGNVLLRLFEVGLLLSSFSTPLLGAGILGDEPRRHALECGPRGDHFDHLALGFANDINSTPRHRAHTRTCGG